jgi:hypothetical protein
MLVCCGTFLDKSDFGCLVLFWIRLFHPLDEGKCSGMDIVKRAAASLFGRIVVLPSRTAGALLNESGYGRFESSFS